MMGRKLALSEGIAISPDAIGMRDDPPSRKRRDSATKASKRGRYDRRRSPDDSNGPKGSKFRNSVKAKEDKSGNEQPKAARILSFDGSFSCFICVMTLVPRPEKPSFRAMH